MFGHDRCLGNDPEARGTQGPRAKGRKARLTCNASSDESRVSASTSTPCLDSSLIFMVRRGVARDGRGRVQNAKRERAVCEMNSFLCFSRSTYR
jgi:hypothetical protein